LRMYRSSPMAIAASFPTSIAHGPSVAHAMAIAHSTQRISADKLRSKLRARPTGDVALPPCALLTGDKGPAGRAFRALFRGALIVAATTPLLERARLFESIWPMGSPSDHFGISKIQLSSCYCCAVTGPVRIPLGPVWGSRSGGETCPALVAELAPASCASPNVIFL
jgi:hypothetical protein